MPKPDFGSRITRLRKAFIESGLDGVIITSINDIYYYTGTLINRMDPGFLVVTKRTSRLFVSLLDNRLENHGASIFKSLADVKKELKKIKRVGFDEKNMSVLLFRRLGSSSWKTFSRQLKSLRMVKDRHEISAIRRACRITLDILGSIELYGRTELEVSADIHNRIRVHGDAPAFDPIVLSGRNSAFVHGLPSRKVISRGLVIVDMGVCHNAYNSDITRTSLIDPKPSEERLIHNCTEIQRELIDMAVPGTAFSDIQKTFEKRIKSLGYRVMHQFGHGLGLSVHERPDSKDILQKGMVLTIEPGIYKKGMGGCRVEDVVLVSDKPVILSR